MPDALTLRRCFVMVQLKPDGGMSRMLKDVPVVMKWLDTWSEGQKPEPLFRSQDGSQMGFFIRTRLPVSQIRTDYERSSHTAAGDSFLVMEVGAEHSALGFQKAIGWLQRA